MSQLRFKIGLFLGASIMLLFGLEAVSAAQDNPPSSSPCDPTTLLCSTGEVAQKYESRARLPVGIDTAWRPECSPATTDGHCTDHKIQLRAQIAFDPLKGSSDPLLSLDMATKPGVIEARWPQVETIELSLASGTMLDAAFAVNHTLTPEFALYLDTPVYKGEIALDASKLIPFIPGGKFNYTARGSKKFAPWGFTKVTAAANGVDLNSSQLFAVTFEQLGKMVGVNFNDYIYGSFSVNATTRTNFNYQTKKVVIAGAEGDITSATGIVKVPSPNENALDFVAHAEGEVSYDGEIEILPVVHITKIANFSIKLDLPISVGLKYQIKPTSQAIVFPTTNVHLPLPNVFVPQSTLDFGSVNTGQKKERNVIIENTGEMAATIIGVNSSDPQFKAAITSARLEPNSTFDLKVVYYPHNPGKQEAQITIKTNDPDAPYQIFKVSGTGVGESVAWAPGESDGNWSTDTGNTDGGCQFGGRPSANGFMLLILAGLILTFNFSRRFRR